MNIPSVPGEKALPPKEGSARAEQEAGDVEAGSKERSLDERFHSSISKGENFVMDYCAGTFLTTKAYLPLKNHRKSVGCDSDSDVPDAAEPVLILEFALQVLSPKYDITKTER